MIALHVKFFPVRLYTFLSIQGDPPDGRLLPPAVGAMIGGGGPAANSI